MRWIALTLTLTITAACATKSQTEDRQRSQGNSAKGRSGQDRRSTAPAFDVASGFRTITSSVSNDAQASHFINRQNADRVAKQLETSIRQSKNVEPRSLVALMAAKRLAGQNVTNVMTTARALVSEAVKRNVDADMPEVAKLELVLAAVNKKRYAMAEHFLIELLRSRNNKIKAAALTVEGIIAMEDGRLPEAVDAWKRALAAEQGYQPAMLNIGFVALQHGDAKVAKEMLSGMQNDWYAIMGLAVAERISGDSRRATQLCNQALSRKGDSRMALFNCAINEYQSNLNFDKARQMLERSAKMRGGPRGLEEKAYRITQRVGQERSKAQQKKQESKRPQSSEANQDDQNRPAPSRPPKQ